MKIDWKYGRKGFIQLVDEEDIPETHTIEEKYLLAINRYSLLVC